MNTLSFREQVFLIMLSKVDNPTHAAVVGDLVEEVDALVERVCEEWGHVPTFFDLSSPGPMTIMNPDKTHKHTRCIRCGKVIE